MSRDIRKKISDLVFAKHKFVEVTSNRELESGIERFVYITAPVNFRKNPLSLIPKLTVDAMCILVGDGNIGQNERDFCSRNNIEIVRISNIKSTIEQSILSSLNYGW